MKIGNRNHISFELTTTDNPSMELSKLNFYLGNKLISNEPIYIPTYISSFQNLLYDITKERFKNIKFETLSPEQGFKTLCEERKTDETQFFRHLFKLDETIDQYTFFIFQMNEMTRFAWTCWDKNKCNSEHELNKIYSVQILTKELISTVNELIERLNKQLANTM